MRVFRGLKFDLVRK